LWYRDKRKDQQAQQNLKKKEQIKGGERGGSWKNQNNRSQINKKGGEAKVVTPSTERSKKRGERNILTIVTLEDRTIP